MPDIKRITLSISSLFLLTPNIILASEYPAPPGHYGQDKILQNSTFNTGKGAPYVSILPVEESLTDETGKTGKNISTPTEPPTEPPTAGPPTELSAGPEPKSPQTANPVMPPPARTPMTAPAAEPIALPMAEQPVYAPAPETAPSRFQQQQIYPDADDLSHHYKMSRQLPFEQWGEQLPETQQPQHSSPAGMEQTFRGSPDLANKMFNPQATRVPAYEPPGRENKNFFNPGSFPVDMMDQFWGGRNSGFMPPVNNQLKTFNQFPVPQNIYGPSTLNLPARGGNRQYFRQIPKEEIIYPPHYPGHRQ